MKDITFKQLVNVSQLHKILVTAGFDIDGVSYDSGTGIATIHLKDTEIKDPTNIMASYVYTAPVMEDLKAQFSAAATANDKIQVIAKRLNLV